MKFKYELYVNGVLWDKFRTIKEVDEFIYEKGFDERLDFIEVKKCYLSEVRLYNRVGI